MARRRRTLSRRSESEGCRTEGASLLAAEERVALVGVAVGIDVAVVFHHGHLFVGVVARLAVVTSRCAARLAVFSLVFRFLALVFRSSVLEPNFDLFHEKDTKG